MGFSAWTTTRAVPAGLAAAVLLLSPATALATTYRVGPGETYATIQDTLGLLAPGDIVEVMGDYTYPGDVWFRTEQSGTAAAPVTVRGIRVNGKRPVLQGVGTEEWHTMIVLLNASHFVFEGFELAGDGNPDHQGVIHKADAVTIRDVVVHDVAGQGLLGTDSESGSLTLEASEFYGNGNGLYDHQIYMATDESMYPGSVFRMQFCYVHDGAGGNNVKSRAERNELYYNWIEGAVYHELDLIGPDGQDPALAREDSDVVGNVLIKHSEWRIARIGGDGTGNTSGRYRFVNNTMILGETSDVAIGLQETVDVLERVGEEFPPGIDKPRTEVTFAAMAWDCLPWNLDQHPYLNSTNATASVTVPFGEAVDSYVLDPDHRVVGRDPAFKASKPEPKRRVWIL